MAHVSRLGSSEETAAGTEQRGWCEDHLGAHREGKKKSDVLMYTPQIWTGGGSTSSTHSEGCIPDEKPSQGASAPEGTCVAHGRATQGVVPREGRSLLLPQRHWQAKGPKREDDFFWFSFGFYMQSLKGKEGGR